IGHKASPDFRIPQRERFIAAPPPGIATKPKIRRTTQAMALTDSNVLKLAPDAGTPAYRSAPHNIEAEQSLLGAILVNNDALYRVSDFLEPDHFFEPIHAQIFDIARNLIRTAKLASPITLKTFLPAEKDIAGLPLGQYLARLAA